MIVPVRRWATTAFFGFSKPSKALKVEEPQKAERKRESLLSSFEKMLAAQTDHVLRGMID